MVTVLIIGFYALLKKDKISPLKLFLLVLFAQILITWFILLFLPFKEGKYIMLLFWLL